jgi:xanthine dehydrogenase/oxidase
VCRSVILRSDLVMDVGTPLNPRVDIGQVEGAFVQGIGLFTMEEKVFLAGGVARTSVAAPAHGTRCWLERRRD